MLDNAFFRGLKGAYLARVRGWRRTERALARLGRAAVPASIYASSKKLNLGSGDAPLRSYLNVDALPELKPDVVCNVSRLAFANDGEFDLVRASHVLEQFAYPDCRRVLGEWRRVLRPGGYLVVCVPDLAALCWRTILRPPGLEAKDDARRDGWATGLSALAEPPAPRRVTVFTDRTLRRLLSDSGFKVVGRLNPQLDEPYAWAVGGDAASAFSLDLAAVKI